MKEPGSIDHYGVYGDLNDGVNIQNEKQPYSALSDMYLLILGLQHRNSIDAAVGSSQGETNLRTKVFERYASPVAFFSPLSFQGGVGMIKFVMFLKV